MPLSLMRLSQRLNALSTPFIADDGTGEDDYALLPPPRQLGMLQLTAITFFAVSGSAYGIEETVSAGGPLLALAALATAAIFWSAPMAMVSAELSVAMPHSGGYIVWVHNAFGPLASLLNGMANLLCNVFDCALYPLLLSQYVERALMPLLPKEPYGGSGASWWRDLAPDVVGSVLRLGLVAFAALVNILGTSVVGVGAVILMFLVTPPIVALIFAAYASPHSEPLMPLTPSVQTPPHSAAQWHFFVALVLWNSCGYDSAGMVAAEVADAPRTYPRALGGALVLTTLSYLLPLAACASVVGPDQWVKWSEGQFELIGSKIGGASLEYALLAASITSEVGVLCTLMLTTSRALVAMAQLRMLPGPLARLHPTLGTPYFAVLLNAALISMATTLLHFEALVELSMFFYAANALVQCATLLRLRRTHPHRLRPTRTLPAPLLTSPVLCALLLMGLTPVRTWLAALCLLGATLIVYGLIHLGRLTHGHKPTDPPSARATAAVEALAVVVPPFAGGSSAGGGGGTDGLDGDGAAGEVRPRHHGSGDAWFGQLLPTYRRVPDREQELQRASSAVQAFEMTPRERAAWGTRDFESADDVEEDAAAAATDDGAAAAEPNELPLTYDSSYEDDEPSGGPRAATRDAAHRTKRGLPLSEVSETVPAPSPAAVAHSASPAAGAVEVSASEAAQMLAAELAAATAPVHASSPATADDFVDIIE